MPVLLGSGVVVVAMNHGLEVLKGFEGAARGQVMIHLVQHDRYRHRHGQHQGASDRTGKQSMTADPHGSKYRSSQPERKGPAISGALE